MSMAVPTVVDVINLNQVIDIFHGLRGKIARTDKLVSTLANANARQLCLLRLQGDGLVP